MNTQKIFPTKFPLFEFLLTLWRLRIVTAIMRPSLESDSYEYIRIEFSWSNKPFFHFRLFDTYIRKVDKLGLLIGSNNYSGDRTVEQLERILDLAIEEIEKVRKK